MPATAIFANEALCVVDYRCTAAPGDPAYSEAHTCYSVAYVRKGSFGYRVGGAGGRRQYELVAGGLLVGHPGAEYACTHDHAHGDECLSFQFAPALVEELGRRALWRAGALPPLAEIAVLGEL